MNRIGGVVYNDTANAPGICTSVYLTGCPLHCKGCHNPELWDDSKGIYYADKLVKIIESLDANGVNRTLCILGGEPLAPYNLEATFNLVNSARGHKVCIWTGYETEELLERTKDSNPDIVDQHTLLFILNSVDTLVVGRYVEELRDVSLKMRGSSNQKILGKEEICKLLRETEE